MRISNEALISSGNAGGNLTSLPGLLAHIYGYTISVTTTGSPQGSIVLQGSNDPAPNANFNIANWQVANWENISGSTVSIVDNGPYVYNVTNAFYNWVRVVFTWSSGSGTMTVTFNSKGV